MGGNESQFLYRNLKSIREQTFQDLEVVVSDNSDTPNLKHVCGLFPELTIHHAFETKKGASLNTNVAIQRSQGEIIKFLFMDDFFAHPKALERIAESFTGGWLATGCNHYNGTETYRDHYAQYNPLIFTGFNTIGAPSVVAVENNKPLLFDSALAWLFDCDYYTRLYDRYGAPTILDDINVTIGVGEHQATSWLSDTIKNTEEKYLRKRYEKRLSKA